jgi:NADH:ubiquinone oxidoreductase subunit E
MTVGLLNAQDVVSAVKEAVVRHGGSREALVPVLADVNQALGYLPGEALAEVGRILQVPGSQVLSVASFYRMLSTKRRGRHVIQFCESAPCHVMGGREVWQSLQDQVELKAGETSADGKWTLLMTSCLGICGVGPVIVIDGEVYGNVTPAQIGEILARYD